MRLLPSLSIAALALGMVACSADGYYDNDGRYHYYTNDASYKAGVHKPNSDVSSGRNSNYNYTFTRRGYYDEYGNFIDTANDENIVVHPSAYPPRGMCRVWFNDRAPEYQPAAQPCARIRSMGIPSGAYVIYGG